MGPDNKDDFIGEFMIAHDVSTSGRDHANVTPDSYYDYVLKGYQVIVGINGFRSLDYETIYDEKYGAFVMTGSSSGNNDKAGHAMTVTGVTDDGRFIVSSWGEKFILDPNLDSGIDVSFTIIRFNS